MTNQTIFGTTTQAADAEKADEREIGRSVLRSCQIDEALPRRLLTKPDGRPCVPLQIDLVPRNADPASLAQQEAFLRSRQPVGGHEAALTANREALLAGALEGITGALSGGATAISFVEVTRQIRDAATGLRKRFEASLQTLEEQQEAQESILRRYVEETAPDSAQGGLLHALARLLNGAVKRAEAVAAFNNRELLNLQCDAQRAAVDIAVQITSSCERLLAGLEVIRAAAVSGAADAQRQVEETLREMEARGRIADYQVDLHSVIAGEIDGVVAGSLGALIAEAREHGSDGIAGVARDIASRLADEHFARLGLVDLIRLDAQSGDVGEQTIASAVAPLTVARHVLDIARRRRPSLRLTDDARPRDYVLQISGDARPLFTHPNLIAAHFHGAHDEFAFMRAQAEVALDELQVMRDGEQDFLNALRRREYFVMEDIAQAWCARWSPAGASTGSDATPGLNMTPSSNGSSEASVAA